MNTRIVIGIIDTSGSMARYSNHMLQSLANMQAELTGCEFHLISFSTFAQHTQDARTIQWAGLETNIPAALQMLEDKFGDRIRALSDADPRAVVFIVTDGDHPYGLTDIKRLKPMGSRCTLITIAVGHRFPTTLVLDSLRGLYNGGDPLDHIPATIQALGSHELSDAISSISSFVKVVDVLVRPLCTPAPGIDEFEIVRHIHATANRTVILACRAGASGILALVDEAASAIQASGELLRNFPARMACANYITFLSQLRQMVAETDVIENKEKLQLTSFVGDCYVYHVCSKSGAAARSIGIAEQWRASLDSFITFMRGFRRGPGGSGDVNTLTFQTEDDMLMSVKADMAGLPLPDEDAAGDAEVARWHEDAEALIEGRRVTLHTEVTGIVEALTRWPLSFHALTTGRRIRPVPAAQSQIWHGVVLKNVARLLTSVDGSTFFYRKMKLSQASGMPAVDDLLLRTKHAALAASPFAAHAASYMILRNGREYSTMAYVAGIAGVVLQTLSSGRASEFEQGVLRSLAATHDAAFRHATPEDGDERVRWSRYIDAAAEMDTVGHTLVPESACGAYSCPDIRKALFAQFAALHGRADIRGDVEEWTFRRRIFMIEFYSRIPFLEDELSDMVMPEDKLRRAVDRFLMRDCPPLATFFCVHPTRRGAVDAFYKAAMDRSGPLMRIEGAPQGTLDAPHMHGMTPATIDGIFRGMCPDLPRMHPIEALACMQTAYRATHREMCYTHGSYTHDVVIDWMQLRDKMMLPRIRPMLEGMIKSFAEDMYDRLYASTHAIALPATVQKMGMNVGPYGLPRNACACPMCPFAYRPLDPPAFGPDGKPRMSPLLRAHLEPMHPIPGLHKALHTSGRLVRFRMAATEEERRTIVEETVESIIRGHGESPRVMVMLHARLRACYGSQPVGKLRADVLCQLEALAACV